MIVETLKLCELFSSLKEDELQDISSLFETVKFKAHEYIFNEGDPCDWFFITAKGRIKIVKHTLAGKDIILEIKSPGEIFGTVAVLDNKPYPASAQAMESGAVVKMSRQNLLKIMDVYPIIKLATAKYFSDRLRDAHEMLKNLATERVERRIAALLLNLAAKIGVENSGFKKIDLQLTRQEIAEMVGTTVETCIRIMSKFQKRGVIKSSQNRILVKEDALQKYLQH